MKLLVLGILTATAYGHTINYAKIEILTEQYTSNLYMLAGTPIRGARIRLISARAATRHEKRKYEETSV